MPDLTTNHGLQLWAAGELDWEHRDDMNYIERVLTVRDFETNLANYTPYDGAKFEATDTNKQYRGDGTNWNEIAYTTSQGIVYDQRGAPTTSELADGQRMVYTSDGTDAHAAGDLVSARNAAGTIVSQVIAAAANDA